MAYQLHLDLVGAVNIAVVSALRGATRAGVSALHSAVPGASVSVLVVAIIALLGESFSVATHFEAFLSSRVKNELGSADSAPVAIRAAQAPVSAGQARPLVAVEVSSDCTAIRVFVSGLLAISNADTSHLRESFFALAGVRSFVEFGVGLIRTLIAEVPNLSAIAQALEPNFREARPAKAFVI